MNVSTIVSPQIWRLHLGDGPLIATAIHEGHDVRDEVAAHLALAATDRWREEDPFTGNWTSVAPTRIVGLRSRFEVDLNRPREKAVYRSPEDAWGLTVWKSDPPEALYQRSLAQYDRYYSAMHELLTEFARVHGRFVVFDLHSYNHRRNGPDGPAADADGHPQVNVGTGTMDRARWGPIVEAFMESLRSFDFPGGPLDVRENVKFFGGHWPRWIHENFPETGVAIAIEFKKFFMDEWTGEPHHDLIDAVGSALESSAAAVLDALQRC